MTSVFFAGARYGLLPLVLAACTGTAALPTSERSEEPDHDGTVGASASGPVAETALDATVGVAARHAGLPPNRGVRAPGGPDAGASSSSSEESDGGTSSSSGSASGTTPEVDGSAHGAWQQVTRSPPFSPSVALVLTDGTVLVHDNQQGANWWRLTPDLSGSYVNGKWSTIAPMPTGYEPTFFASAVLADGRVLVMGGEYIANTDVESNLGAIYDPAVDVWTPVAAPNPFDSWYWIGDSNGIVLANGTFMLEAITGKQLALFDARTLTWTTLGQPGNDSGIGKADDNAEEGWTLLPSGKVLTVDTGYPGNRPTTNSEIFDPSTGIWTSAGSTGPALSDGAPNYEIGPQVLMPNGSVFAIGATGSTAIYSAAGTWSRGPTFPQVETAQGLQQLEIADGPAALLPNGNVLCVASPGLYEPGAEFFEFDGASLREVSTTENGENDSSFNVFLLVVPSGQVMATDYSTDVELYTSTGEPDAAWAPSISHAPSTVVRGTTYPLEGKQFNGLSQAVAYGDDYQGATNYPLVRITNDATGHVFYGRTHDHSTMGVATGNALVSTLFEASVATETGDSKLVVVANGIASVPVAITVQ